jgi:hypothetical protein
MRGVVAGRGETASADCCIGEVGINIKWQVQCRHALGRLSFCAEKRHGGEDDGFLGFTDERFSVEWVWCQISSPWSVGEVRLSRCHDVEGHIVIRYEAQSQAKAGGYIPYFEDAERNRQMFLQHQLFRLTGTNTV